jgi:biopolymer transport protein ExbB
MRRFVVVLSGFLVAGPIVAQDSSASLEEARNTVQRRAAIRDAENEVREQRFIAALDQQEDLLRAVVEELGAENARSDQLKAAFDQNETSLADLEETRRVRVGNMGELFGVVRQVAGDTKGIVDTSLISAQLRGRSALADELAQADELPSMGDLTDLYMLLLEEMAESGKVVRYDTEIIATDGRATTAEVVRVGVFNVISGSDFLQFEPQTSSLRVLARQPARRFSSLADGLFGATSGVVPMALDPSRGNILGLLIQAPSLIERIQQGGLVGYVILLLGSLGVLVSIERLITLARASRGIQAQLGSAVPNGDNALGRILQVYESNSTVDSETLGLKLDEAILREAPILEKWQGWIKVLAAVAPLLGLLGTVVGMIRTFQAITLFGTGDPKLMAGGISQALVTTVLGLTVAIPLVLLHSLVSGRSRTLVEILEGQSAGIIARHSDSSDRGETR